MTNLERRVLPQSLRRKLERFGARAARLRPLISAITRNWHAKLPSSERLTNEQESKALSDGRVVVEPKKYSMDRFKWWGYEKTPFRTKGIAKGILGKVGFRISRRP